MTIAVDHLIIAARTLDEGTAWVASHLGAAPAGGGRHPLMGTHNRLLGLGPGAYLEVIAIDPEAPQPPHPRWFSLDAPHMRERLARGPALVHWMMNTADIAMAAAHAPVDLGEIIAVTRGDYRWRVTVRPDGGMPAAGVFPSLIQWDSDRPAASLPDAGCRIESLELAHPDARAFGSALCAMGLAQQAWLATLDGEPRVTARIRAPAGAAVLI